MKWKPVPGYLNYEASDTGEIRNLGHRYWVTQPHRSYWVTRKPFVVKQFPMNGYFYVSIESAPVAVHRLVCAAFHGPAPVGRPLTLHEDDVGTNNVPGNLRWGSHKENGEDAVANGRYPTGESHHATTLCIEEVREIRRRYKPKCKRDGAKPLGREFGVDFTTIQNIVARRTWADQD